MNIEGKRDYLAGGLIALVGAAAAYQGSTYGVGSMVRMETGFFPVAIGIGMVLVGIGIAVFGSKDDKPAATGLEDPHHTAAPMSWRGWIAITAGVCLFIALCNYAGLAPAIFACVFVSAMGTTTTNWKEAAVLAACVTVFGIALFAYGLKVPIPIVQAF